MTKKTGICSVCGQLQGIKEYDVNLWKLYNRLKSGVQHVEPLVFYNVWSEREDEDSESMILAMERDMGHRGLCPHCSRPNLRGKTDEDFNSESEAKDLAEMYAEQAAERRAGC